MILPPATAVGADRLVEHAHNYLAALEDNLRPWPGRRDVLVAARDRLRRLDVRGIPYRRVLLAAKDAPGIRASGIFSPASLEFLASRGDVQIPGQFTAAGWEKIRLVLLIRRPARQRDRRAMGARRPEPAGRRRVPARAGAAGVLRRVHPTLDVFLDELKVKTPTDVPTATAELSAFKEGDGFYRTLFDTFKRNAIHDEEPTGLLDALDAGSLLSRIPWFKSEADASAKASGPSPVETSFRPLLLFAGVAGVPTAPPRRPARERPSTSTWQFSTSSRRSSTRRPRRRPPGRAARRRSTRRARASQRCSTASRNRREVACGDSSCRP